MLEKSSVQKMIDLLQSYPTVNAKTANDNWRLANPNHTVDMNEANAKMERILYPVNSLNRHSELVGKKSGRYTIVSVAGRDHSGIIYYNCRCDCGSVAQVVKNNLIRGNSKSCGCLAAELTKEREKTHGLCRVPEYKNWRAIRERCLNKKCKYYPDYGGRGISICSRWRISFKSFYDDMGARPDGIRTIDRRNNECGYWCGSCAECVWLGRESNCRWATYTQQARNTRNTTWITVNGETKSAAEWAEIRGMKKELVYARIALGWTPQDAVLIPVRKMKPRTKSDVLYAL